MSRRRPTLSAYVRRRWRALGLTVVLLAGSLLVLAITDRGHDPLWGARGAVPEPVDVSPDGSVVYSLLLGEDGNVSGLQARRGADGELVWESPVSAPRALMRAAADGVVVATDFPLAFLTFFGADGSLRWQIALEGTPRALVVEGERVALALQAPGNPVIVVEEGRIVRSHRFEAFVNALDIAAGRIAAGTSAGNVSLFDEEGEQIYNASLSMGVRSLRLSSDGYGLLAGGFSLQQNNLSGHLAYVDLHEKVPLRWTATTASGVGLVDLDRAGVLVLALEESPSHATAHVYEAGTGARLWSRDAEGTIARDDAGRFAGAALSPDGATLVMASWSGPVTAYRVRDASLLWTFDSAGSTALAFARDRDDLFAANGRLAPNTAYDTVFLFSVDEEPVSQRAPVAAATLLGLALATGTGIVGVGYWRVRRSY